MGAWVTPVSRRFHRWGQPLCGVRTRSQVVIPLPVRERSHYILRAPLVGRLPDIDMLNSRLGLWAMRAQQSAHLAAETSLQRCRPPCFFHSKIVFVKLYQSSSQPLTASPTRSSSSYHVSHSLAKLPCHCVSDWQNSFGGHLDK